MELGPSLVAIPIAALRERGVRHAVIVRKGHDGLLHDVTVVLRSSSEVIVSGLPAGSQIAASADAYRGAAL
jgi:hypothetical protein